jgi:hypothetical protein
MGALKHRLYERGRKRRLRAAGLCVNGKSHGKAFKGGRCEACWNRKLEAQREPQRLAYHVNKATGGWGRLAAFSDEPRTP